MYQETQWPEVCYHNLFLGLKRAVQKMKSEHKWCVQISVEQTVL